MSNLILNSKSTLDYWTFSGGSGLITLLLGTGVLVSSFIFLADRTNGRAYATVLCPSVCRRLSSVTLCIVAKRCVLEQKQLLASYRKSYEESIDTKMNDLDLCLEVVSRSCQPLRHIRHWISRKQLEIEAWF